MDLPRRTFLRLGGAGLGGLLFACRSGSLETIPEASSATAGSTAGTIAQGAAADTPGLTTTIVPPSVTDLSVSDFAGIASCRLTPAQSEGPFYLPADLLRKDITEAREGHPLRVGLRVVDSACDPIPGALVDIWHADHDGDYSAFRDGSSPDEEGSGSTFLRGSQLSNNNGIVEFQTNYPGWYPGRAVHIHVKVNIAGVSALTSQMYFPEDVTDGVHSLPLYSPRGSRDTFNNTDFLSGGDPAASGHLLEVTEEDSALGGGKLGLLVLGVEG